MRVRKIHRIHVGELTERQVAHYTSVIFKLHLQHFFSDLLEEKIEIILN